MIKENCSVGSVTKIIPGSGTLYIRIHFAAMHKLENHRNHRNHLGLL